MEKMKEACRYTLKWFAFSGYIIFPTIYLLIVLLCGCNINAQMLLFWFVLGLLIRNWFKSWNSKILDNDYIDFEPKDGVLGIQGKTFKQFVKDMPYWERLHWIPILIFLGLTCYAMWNGLDLLFIQSTVSRVFISIFSITVTFTLGWLILMISTRRKIWGFLIFYLVFDLLGAFSFNFVHFYDNISYTQRMDSDMKACRMYNDIQLKNVALIKSHADKGINELKAKIEQDSIERSIRTSTNNKALNQLLKRYRTGLISQDDFDRESKKLNRKIAKETELSSVRINSNAIGLKKQSEDLDSLVSSLTKICIDYEDPNIDSIGLKDVYVAKHLVNEIQKTIEVAAKSNYINDSTMIVVNDTINFVLEKFSHNEGDKFSSLKKLFNAMIEIATPDLSSREDLDESPIEKLRAEEKSFENRLLLLSIMLSILIDVVPLALGVFVSYSKYKQT